MKKIIFLVIVLCCFISKESMADNSYGGCLMKQTKNGISFSCKYIEDYGSYTPLPNVLNFYFSDTALVESVANYKTVNVYASDLGKSLCIRLYCKKFFVRDLGKGYFLFETDFELIGIDGIPAKEEK